MKKNVITSTEPKSRPQNNKEADFYYENWLEIQRIMDNYWQD